MMHALKMFALLLVAVAAPLLWYGVKWAETTAKEHGCQLNEAGTYPCMVEGADIGPLLSDLFTAGWIAMFLTPLSALAALALLVMGLKLYTVRRKAEQPN